MVTRPTVTQAMPMAPTRDAAGVNQDRNALRRLTGAVPEFGTDVFGRRPLYLPAVDADGFADLLSLADVDHIVTSTGLRAPAFRLVREGATLPAGRVTRQVRIGSKPVHDLVDVAAVQREFADGATIVLQGLHRSWPAVATFCRSLEAQLTHPVQANAYLTPPVAQGLDLHADPHDVFALQTHGVKRWVVHAREEEPWDLQLRPGDVLYLPAGTRHAAQTTDEPSLHLTLGVRTLTWKDAVRRALESMLAEVDGEAELAEPLPAAWADDPTALADALRDRLEGLVRSTDHGSTVGTALSALAEGFWQGSPPDLSGSLLDTLEIAAIEDATRLRVRADAICRLRERDDRLEVMLRDRLLRTPSDLAPAFRRVLELHTFAPKELDGLLDEPSRLVLTRRLVREGLLTVDRDPPHG